MPRPSASSLVGLLALCLGAACSRDEIRTYRVAKEPVALTPPAAQPPMAGATTGPSMASTPVDTAAGPGLAWDLPAGWTQGPERPMRKATLIIPASGDAPGAEVSVTAFPGDVGGNLANVNRWRQQLALPPIGENELGAALTHLDAGGLHVDYVELVGAGAPAQRVLGAIVPHAGATWFFKLSGPDAIVAREKPAFLTLLRSLRPQS